MGFQTMTKLLSPRSSTRLSSGWIPTKLLPRTTSKPRKRRSKVLSVHFSKKWQQPLVVVLEGCQEGCLVGCPGGGPVDLVVLRLEVQRLLLVLIWMMVPISGTLINAYCFLLCGVYLILTVLLLT